MSVYVFLGPTLQAREARRYLDAQYLPPVSQGDVLRVLERAPRAIAIVDGYFELVPSVWHKEILLALEAGVHVFGAASMGALRAAELDVFGMKGVGEIYRWYATGRIEDDDEVAVVQGPAEHGYRELSEAMVNLRDRCRSAAKNGVVSKRVADRFVDVAKALFYPDRRWRRIFEEARAAGVDERDVQAMAAYLAREKAPSLKARDAIALLEHLASFMTRAPKPFRARVRTERTKFIRRLLAEVALPPSGRESPTDRGESSPLERRAEELALLGILAEREALHGGHQVTDEDAQAAEDTLRRDLGLLGAADTARWLERAGLSSEDFNAWMRDDALAKKLRLRFGHAITFRTPIEARRLRARALLELLTTR